MRTRHDLIYSIRYSIRLTQRQARLYRRIQAAGIFLGIIGGSATLSLPAQSFPEWVSIAGAVLLADLASRRSRIKSVMSLPLARI
jgi:hypothetical protein